MKTRIILILLLVATIGQLQSQTYPTGMRAHGTNSLGTVTVAENTDSVAVGGTLEYFVMPDATLNAGYDYATNPLTNLNSTFDWTGTTGQSSITYKKSGVTDIPNYVSIVWGATTGTYQVSVAEQAAAGCADPTPTVIPVQIIARPTLTYPVAGGSQSFCSTAADGSTNISPAAMTVNFTSSVSGNRGMQLRYTITSVSHGTVATNVLASITETSATTGTFTLAAPLNNYDTYTITLTEVTDRITRKSNVTGSPSGNLTYTVIINRTPSTGTIYHVPNQ